jgi:hypothetical protein
MTRDDLLALPATIDLLTAARALGIGRNQAYDLASRGEFPCRVLKLGKRYKVVTEELLRHLGVDRGPSRPTETVKPPAAQADLHGRALNASGLRRARRIHLVTDEAGRIAVGTCTRYYRSPSHLPPRSTDILQPPAIALPPGLVWVHASYEIDTYVGGQYLSTGTEDVWEVQQSGSHPIP